MSGMIALDEWKKTLADHLLRAEAALEEARARLEDAELTPVERLHRRRQLDDAEHNSRLVKLGHGEHNVTYATALLNVAMRNCRPTSSPVAASVKPSAVNEP